MPDPDDKARRRALAAAVEALADAGATVTISAVLPPHTEDEPESRGDIG